MRGHCSPEKRAACPLQNYLKGRTITPPIFGITCSATIFSLGGFRFFIAHSAKRAWLFVAMVVEIDPSFVNWRQECIYFSQASVNTVMKSPFCQPKVSFPRRYTLGYFSYCYKPVTRKMRCLLNLGRPFTVRRLIVSIAVNPINRVLNSRLLTHIAQEVYKSIIATPTVANLNPSASIAVISPIFSIITTHHHTPIRVHLRPIFQRTTMTILRVILPAKHSTSVASRAAFATINCPSTCKTVKSITTFAFHSITTTSFFKYGKCAVAIHKHNITQHYTRGQYE